MRWSSAGKRRWASERRGGEGGRAEGRTDPEDDDSEEGGDERLELARDLVGARIQVGHRNEEEVVLNDVEQGWDEKLQGVHGLVDDFGFQLVTDASESTIRDEQVDETHHNFEKLHLQVKAMIT